jgi:AbrB family looped-hinge helix DNA binding protein
MPVMIRITKKGSITIPVGLREKYGLNEGTSFNLIDLGKGSLLLTPRASEVDRLGDRISEILREEAISPDDLLNEPGEERERYYREHFAKD